MSDVGKRSGQRRKSSGNPLEIRGNLLKIPGNPLEIYWKSSGNLLEIRERREEFQEIRWKSTENPRMSSGIPGNSRKSKEIRGNPGNPVNRFWQSCYPLSCSLSWSLNNYCMLVIFYEILNIAFYCYFVCYIWSLQSEATRKRDTRHSTERTQKHYPTVTERRDRLGSIRFFALPASSSADAPLDLPAKTTTGKNILKNLSEDNFLSVGHRISSTRPQRILPLSKAPGEAPENLTFFFKSKREMRRL